MDELNGIQAEPAPIVNTEPDATDSNAEPTSTATITGGDGIGPVGEGGGFLWKPVSESTGKLVVLLPPQYTGHASGAYVATTSGSKIEGGAYAGVHNGDRLHYRFSQSGSGYGRNIIVVANLSAGGSIHWPIPNGASRTTY